MLSRIGWTRIAYAMAAIAVSCGAVGSHLLDDVLEGNAANQWQIATRMLFWHALGLWICASTARYRQGALMLISVLIFCGSVFSLSLGGPGWLGMVAPLGGAGMVVSWLWLAVGKAPEWPAPAR
jgi:uncharacterized membrane protein YgdD (TMEM256/DUF423 family)